jgi:pimeloyl-ACP methyl ester carboxylesterase/tRNA A-37 threonylcarbamoyl transferase component Bud32
MPLQPGDKLGPYEILAPIGAGGMGEVYKARDTRLDRIVAIKRLNDQHTARFQQEAHAIAALNHTNICQIYDVGPDYLVMEYVEGKPLSGPLRVEEAVKLALQIASAMEEAHAKGILHRDLKPANILVTSKSAAKLVDFGLAKLVTDSDTDATKTLDGTVMGTAAYMAPEQAEGKPLDARSDVFSFGAVLYEMLSGHRAFGGNSTAQVLSAVLRDDPAPLQAPAELQRIVRKCLAKQPGARFPNMVDLRTALEQIPARLLSDDLADEPAAPRAQLLRARQEIRYCTTRDGVRLGYASSGSGPPLVKASNWLTHLDFEWDSPIWRHWWAELSAHHRVIRYDERGNGMSQRDVADVSFETWVRDLETVVDAAGLDRFPLLGISRGGSIAIAYAVKHPERVSHLVLYGAFAAGYKLTATPKELEAQRALASLVRLGWGVNNPAFRKVFTCRFIPDATPEHQQWFDELQRVSTSAENAARLMEIDNEIDVRTLLPAVTVPTLVVHCDRDQVVPVECGRLLAAKIPRARYVSLPSANHLVLEEEPAWQTFLDELALFLLWRKVG